MSSVKPASLIALLALYFTINVLVRLALPDSLELDEAQQIFFSQYLALGYGTQPPFYNWLQYGVIALFGPSVASLTVLKNLLLVASLLLYYNAARLLVRGPLLALIATLGLLTLPQIAFEAQRDLTHTVALIFATSLFLYGMARTLTKGDLPAYALTGLAIGIGLISKYNFALFAGAAFIGLLVTPNGRSRIFDPRLMVTLVLAGVVVAPHTIWLVNHLDEATASTVVKMTALPAQTRLAQIGLGLRSLLLAILGFCALTVAIFLVSFGRSFIVSLTAKSQGIKIFETIFVVSFLALIALILSTQTTLIKDRWLIPILLMLPLYFAMKFDAAGIDPKNHIWRLWAFVLLIALAVPLALYLRVTYAPSLNQYQKLNTPYSPAIGALLAMKRPGAILAGDQHLAGNIALHVGSIVVMSADRPDFSPAIDWQTNPLLIMWRAKGEEHPAMPKAIQGWLASKPEFSKAEIAAGWIALPFHYGKSGDKYGFGYAWVKPN